MCQALPFSFALTGCDFVSMFGMVCMAKVSKSNRSFEKIKYLSPIYKSSKIIRSNKFYFQQTCYMFELTCLSGSYG